VTTHLGAGAVSVSTSAIPTVPTWRTQSVTLFPQLQAYCNVTIVGLVAVRIALYPSSWGCTCTLYTPCLCHWADDWSSFISDDYFKRLTLLHEFTTKFVIIESVIVIYYPIIS